MEPKTRANEAPAEGLRGLYADEARVAPDERRVLKVQIPQRLHLRLHALRITRGESVSGTVEAALEGYFARMAAARTAGAPSGPRFDA
ncbi:MAG: hypothetical protein LC624_03480 [Halobacteriales archaeon]|nr:hypothetical protein [Halobacteriales archaeon]